MKKNISYIAFGLLGVLMSTSQSFAYVSVGTNAKVTESGSLLKTTAGCKQAVAAIDLDINNVRAKLMTGGDMWYNLGTNNASYEIPKGSQKHSLYAGSCWIGGIDGTGQLKVSAQLYRSSGNDYWPGPIDRSTGDITAASCSEWDKFWKVNASTIQKFRTLYKDAGAGGIIGDEFNVIKEWPATGNVYAVGNNGNSLPELLASPDAYGYAPFVDANSDGKYNWKDGDYPAGYGAKGSNPSQFIWWVFNDKGGTKTMTKTASIGMEVQTSAFAYSSSDFLNDATFYNYRLINRGVTVLDSCFIATWTDADLGNAFDDYIGCDTARGLGILYNGESPDRANGQNCYGTRLPMVGIDFFIGPRKYYTDSLGKKASRLLKMSTFSYFENTPTGAVKNPQIGTEFYNYMTGSTANGIPFSFDGIKPTSKGYGSGPIAPYVFYGDPANKAEWSMCSCNSALADRRFIHSSGPFTLYSGEKNDITIGAVWVDDVGGCPNTSFKKIRAADDIAQSLFDNGFKRIVGPEAPILKIRELDKKLIFYISNPISSNNYNEQYGDPKFSSDERFRVVSTKAKAAGSSDSIYRFEGYRVYQLRNATVSLFDENGDLTSDAVEVFQCDVKNGVKQIANFTKNLEIKSSIDQYNTSIKVNGKDNGIVHSFVLTEDAFATGSNNSLVNYKTYYYKVVAYAYNNFAPFDPHNEVGTQDKAYLAGDNGPGESVNDPYAAMPNAMNQMGDTFSHSVYGDGVIVTRIEGMGNGGNDVQIDDTTEAAVLLNGNVPYPTYKAGKSPVNIKVVDPVKVVDAEWRISLLGATNSDLYRGLNDTATWKIEKLNSNGTIDKVIYSEKNISVANEQLLADYGLSVSVTQSTPPGFDQVNGNGYITSDVTFQNTATPWLAGVTDGSSRSFTNWIRSGNFEDQKDKDPSGAVIIPPCGPFDDYKSDTVNANYSLMFSNNTNVQSTWAPYDLVNSVDGTTCGFAPAYGPAISATSPSAHMYVKYTTPIPAFRYSEYPNVDLVFTSDKSKWTRCVVLEAQNSPLLSEGGAVKFSPRSHKSWNLGIDAADLPIYATNPKDTGFSYFPGYAINQLTGERLNIVFTEDSYLKKYNGADMLWNPTADMFDLFGETIFGGKHFTYVLNTKYDSCKAFVAAIPSISTTSPNSFALVPAFRQMRWVGIPMLNTGWNYLSLKDGLIPTETRLRFRVNTPYKQYPLMPNQVAVNGQNPMYKFTTKGLAPNDYTQNTDADALLDRIFAVPNPYKGQASGGNSYETNRLETKIKIINLPVKATINIYSLDGTLVRRLEKDNNEPAISWDLYNQAGLPIASGMYLIHVHAYGKDKVIRWFGGMRPLDVTNN